MIWIGRNSSFRTHPLSRRLRTTSMTAAHRSSTDTIVLSEFTVLSEFEVYRDPMNISRRLRSVPAPDDSDVLPEPTIDAATALMRRVQRGDRAAFASLYDELSSLIYGIVLRVVRDPAISEEVTQEVFVEIWKTAQRFDPARGSVKTWSATMAHRRAVDRVRSVEAARRRDQADADLVPVERSGVDDEVVASMESKRVRAALDVLTSKQRAAIELAYFDGLSYRDVAVALDLPEGTIKSRIRDGMNRLRTELQGAHS